MYKNEFCFDFLQDFLDRMHKEHGSHDLEWLRDIPPDKAK